MKKSCIFAAYAFACLIAPPAHSYVDPASDSMGAELIIAAIVAATIIIFFTISKYFYRLTQRKSRLDEPESKNKTDGTSQETNPNAADEPPNT